MDNKLRLVALGLDSLPPGLTKTLAATGVMPFINELMEKGSFGPLNSVVPSNTGSGWNSAWTGQPPERHGFFGFYHYDYEDDIIRMSTSDRLKEPTLWQMLNAHGLRTLIINSPMQYPVSKLDGVMISGFIAPSIKARSVYPPSFREKLASEIPDYIFDVPWEKYKVDDKTFESNINCVIKVFHQRVKVSRLAAETAPWDVMVVVFKSIDNMLHFTWDYLSRDCPDQKRHKLTLEAFRVLDDSCRELAAMAGYPDANILVLSDHGHGPIKGHLYVNRLLAQWGFLVPQSKLNRTLHKYITSLRKRIKADKLSKKLSSNIGVRLKAEWAKTQAVMINQGIIYLNVKGRQPMGVVPPEQYEQVRNNIADHLLSLRDDAGGAALIDKVVCPVEAGPGPSSASGPIIPDIVMQPTNGVVLRTGGLSPKSRRVGLQAWQPGCIDNLQGTHYFKGIVLGAGPSFSRGASVEGDLFDITPTIMAACGLPVPQGLIGKPITKLLNSQIKVEYSHEQVRLAESEDPPPAPCSAEDEEVIRRRLENLGYLD